MDQGERTAGMKGDLLENQDQAAQEAARKRHFIFRLNVFFFCTFLLFSVLVIQLAFLQFVQVDEMRAREETESTISLPIAPIRGNIFDRNGYPIAYTESTQSLYYRAERGADKDMVIALAYRLADIFAQYGEPGKALSAEEVIKRMDVGYDLNKRPTKAPGYLSNPRRIKESLSPREIAYVLEHRDELKGVEIVEESIRRYDPDTIAVQLIGYLREYSTASNPDQAAYLSKYRENTGQRYLLDEYVGYDGLEFMYQDVLRGTNGRKTFLIDARQKIIGLHSVEYPKKGNNLVLSLDKDVQLATENAIMEHLEWLRSEEGRKYNKTGVEAVAGYAVAMEIETGHIVAMASMPDYDTNVWRGGILTNQDYQAIQFRVTNGAIRERYADLPDGEHSKHPTSLVPLGSTMKPLTVLVGLNEGVISPKTRYSDRGYFEFGRDGSRIRNSGGAVNGVIGPADAIRRSSNTFMAEMVGNQLYRQLSNPVDVWDSYMKQFGLGVSTESGLPGESSGDPYYFKTSQNASEQAAMVFASFGQQGRYTALQLAQYTAMLANRGKRLKPQFVREIRDYEGNLIEKFDEPIILNEVDIPDEYWDIVEKGMETNVSYAFADFPYDFRRKTGTSESDIAGKRVENAVFIAYAPRENPKLAVAVVVPEGGFGSWGAAPIARKIFDAYDEYIGLQP